MVSCLNILITRSLPLHPQQQQIVLPLVGADGSGADKDTKAFEFRRLLREITFYLGFEATRTIGTTTSTVTTPMGVEFAGKKIAEDVAIIPILRAGLTMADGMLDLIPTAAVHHIGMFRSKISHMPVQYYNRLPHDRACDVAYVVDPCVATSNTLHAVVSILKRWGAKRIVVIAAVACSAGITKLSSDHPDIEIFVGDMDETLSEEGMIVPGIGDAGDRQFGTPHEDEQDILPQIADTTELEAPAPVTRKRAAAAGSPSPKKGRLAKN